MNILLQTERRTPEGKVLPLASDFTRWFERVNAGARFHLDFKDELLGPHGEPYVRLPLAPEGEESYTFTELALFLYNRSFGALLTQPDRQLGEEADMLEVSLGDIADFLATGYMQDRVPITPPWGYPDPLPDEDFSPLLDPGMVTLPLQIRRNINWTFKQVGAIDAGVSLVEEEGGLRYLWFQYRPHQELSEGECLSVARRIFWYMPRHYAILVTMTEQDIRGYPLVPQQESEEESE